MKVLRTESLPTNLLKVVRRSDRRGPYMTLAPDYDKIARERPELLKPTPRRAMQASQKFKFV